MCQAVGLLNGEILETPNARQAHNVLRESLVSYADHVAAQLRRATQPDITQLAREVVERGFTRGYEQAREEDLKAATKQFVQERHNSSVEIGINIGVTRVMDAIRSLTPKVEEKGK